MGSLCLVNRPNLNHRYSLHTNNAKIDSSYRYFDSIIKKSLSSVFPLDNELSPTDLKQLCLAYKAMDIQAPKNLESQEAMPDIVSSKASLEDLL